jgi:hypothetical protein
MQGMFIKKTEKKKRVDLLKDKGGNILHSPDAYSSLNVFHPASI